MHKLTLFILAAVFAVALAEGQYYVPRAYYTIDAEGHESAHVPLRRLRRSLQPYPYTAEAHASADAESQRPSIETCSAFRDSIAFSDHLDHAHMFKLPTRRWSPAGILPLMSKALRGKGLTEFVEFPTFSRGEQILARDGGGRASANANANANSGSWDLPSQQYGASNPALLSSGMTRRQYGPALGQAVIASTSVGVNSNGQGYYDQIASVH
ncbi:hypothetical protein HF086_014784 [Spodoptera exigua]|uniref:Uncharacterized protein n=1 Tax=Spodoptera exigua TaxID=7107 RepID=A0A922MHD0_SPOEX|nr:hypothetical protein HF086_014784 [Spodoptera exigua]